MKYNKIAFIGYASGWGANDPGTSAGPAALKNAQIIEKLNAQGIAAHWYTTIEAKPYNKQATVAERLEQVVQTNQQLAQAVTSCIEQQQFPVVIGGDHSCAIGTWSGVTDALAAKQNFGLLWFDAHMDAHTYKTSLSNNPHGMPVASLLGQGDKKLTDIAYAGAKIKPENLAQIGIRSYEDAEADLLKSLGSKVFFANEISQRRLTATVSDALKTVRNKTKAFGLSIDVDVFDPGQVSGFSCPEKNGLLIEEVLPEVEAIAATPGLAALEIAEFNPFLDKNQQTLDLIIKILLRILAKVL